MLRQSPPATQESNIAPKEGVLSQIIKPTPIQPAAGMSVDPATGQPVPSQRAQTSINLSILDAKRDTESVPPPVPIPLPSDGLEEATAALGNAGGEVAPTEQEFVKDQEKRKTAFVKAKESQKDKVARVLTLSRDLSRLSAELHTAFDDTPYDESPEPAMLTHGDILDYTAALMGQAIASISAVKGGQ